MQYKKIKNGFEITVQKWSNDINIKNLSTMEVITKTFSDHITAITLAKKL